MRDEIWSDSESENEEGTSESQFSPRLFSVLVAIDTERSMFDAKENGRSPFMESLEACRRLADNLVLATAGPLKGPLGMVFADNDPDKAQFLDFDKTVLDAIDVLKPLCRLSNEDLTARYSRKGDFDFADFLLHCMRKFSTIKGNLFKRTVLYITGDDDPIKNDDGVREKFRVMNNSTRFAEAQMYLHVLTFNPSFDQDKVYAEILAAANSPDVVRVDGVPKLLAEIDTLVRDRYTRYPMKFYPFQRADIFFDAVIHKFVRRATIVKNKKVTRDTQEEVVKRREDEDDDEASANKQYTWQLKKRDLRFTFDAFEKDNFGDLILPIGFHLVCIAKPTTKWGWVVERATLLEKRRDSCDSEDPVDDVFDVFWEFCKEKSRCLICLRRYRKTGGIRYVELAPKYVNETRMFLVRTFPPGPAVRYSHGPKPKPSFTQEEKDAMGDLVNAFTIEYEPDKFTHPVVGKKRAYLKSQLLGEPMENVDTGIPTDEHVNQLIAEQVDRLKQLGLGVSTSKGPKRRTAGKPANQSNKKAKQS